MQVSFTSLIGQKKSENITNLNYIKRTSSHPKTTEECMESAFARINTISGRKTDVYLHTTDKNISIMDKDGRTCYAQLDFATGDTKPNKKTIRKRFESFVSNFEQKFKERNS